MPWRIEKRDEEFCVIKESDGAVEGCHSSRDGAADQLAALNASENQDKGILVGFSHTDGPTSFADLERVEEAEERGIRLFNLQNKFMRLVSNIFSNPDVDKGTAIRTLTSELIERMEAEIESGELEVKDSYAYLYKDSSGGSHIVLVYSNKWRDDDRPSEIIASSSHRNLVKMVDEGIVPLPELWLWHEPLLKWGQAEWLAYDESGYALAGCSVDKGFEPVAEAIVSGDFGVSHGMPDWSVIRDSTDPSIIKGHITTEISPLPIWAAANKGTYIYRIKETNMIPAEKRDRLISHGIPAEKRDRLISHGIPADLLERIESQNKQYSGVAQEEGRDSKEQTVVDPAVEATSDNTEEETVEVISEVTLEIEGDTVKEIDLIPVVETLVKAITTLSESVGELNQDVASLKQERAVEQTPLLSLVSKMSGTVASAVGQDSTRVDGRTSIAKSGPQEQKGGHPNGRSSGIPIVDHWTSGGG